MYNTKHRIRGIGVGVIIFITIMNVINILGDILLKLYNDVPFAIALYILFLIDLFIAGKPVTEFLKRHQMVEKAL